MSCELCKGTGFVLKRGDFRARSGTVYKDVESVTRCPDYKRYFDELPNIKDKPIWNAHFCDYAQRTHQEIFDQAKKKDGAKDKRY